VVLIAELYIILLNYKRMILYCWWSDFIACTFEHSDFHTWCSHQFKKTNEFLLVSTLFLHF